MDTAVVWLLWYHWDDDVTKLCPYNCEGTTATVHFNTSPAEWADILKWAGLCQKYLTRYACQACDVTDSWVVILKIHRLTIWREQYQNRTKNCSHTNDRIHVWAQRYKMLVLHSKCNFFRFKMVEAEQSKAKQNTMTIRAWSVNVLYTKENTSQTMIMVEYRTTGQVGTAGPDNLPILSLHPRISAASPPVSSNTWWWSASWRQAWVWEAPHKFGVLENESWRTCFLESPDL